MQVTSQVLTTGVISFGAVAAVLLLPAVAGRVRLHGGWFIGGFSVFCAYCLAVGVNISIWPVEAIFGPVYYNWGGKFLGILVWLTALLALSRFAPSFKPADAGFTFQQTDGSLVPAIVAISLFVAFNGIISYTTSTASYNAEILWFQAIVPGLDEEPIFRGILLYMLARAVNSPQVSCFGARLEYAGIGLCLMFGALHAAFAAEYGAYFVCLIFGITTTYALALLWLRERTGSLLLPIVAHNLVNLSGQLIRPLA